nr:MAG: hypothetical protein [Bacteriophage sp.]
MCVERRRNRKCQRKKKIVEKLKEAIPKMSEFDKGYILGKVESFSDNSLEQKTDKKKLLI